MFLYFDGLVAFYEDVFRSTFYFHDTETKKIRFQVAHIRGCARSVQMREKKKAYVSYGGQSTLKQQITLTLTY
jgi:hypothetical protein